MAVVGPVAIRYKMFPLSFLAPDRFTQGPFHPISQPTDWVQNAALATPRVRRRRSTEMVDRKKMRRSSKGGTQTETDRRVKARTLASGFRPTAPPPRAAGPTTPLPEWPKNVDALSSGPRRQLLCCAVTVSSGSWSAGVRSCSYYSRIRTALHAQLALTARGSDSAPRRLPGALPGARAGWLASGGVALPRRSLERWTKTAARQR